MLLALGGYTGPLIGLTVLRDCERLNAAEVGPYAQQSPRPRHRNACTTEKKQKWWGMPMLSTPRSAFAAALCHGVVYALGGQANDGSNKKQGGANYKRYVELATVERLEVSPRLDNRWQPNVVPDMSSARVGHAAAAVNGRLFAIGGFDGFFLSSAVESIALPPPAPPPPPRPSENLDEGEEWEEGEEGRGEGEDWEDGQEAVWEGGKWEEEAAMHEPRNGFGACVVNGQIWVAGGNKGFHCLDTTEVYDPHSCKWISGPRMEEARHWHAVASVPANNRIYALGGWALTTVKEWDGRRGVYQEVQREHTRLLSHVESLDPREGKWRVETPMNQGRVFHAAAAAGNFLYALGGCDYSGEALQSVEVFDVRLGRWLAAPNLEINRTYLSALVVPMTS